MVKMMLGSLKRISGNSVEPNIWISADDGTYSVIQTSDGGYALAGYTYSNAQKVNIIHGLSKRILQEAWNGKNLFETGGDAQALSLIQTDDGGYALVGYKKRLWSRRIGNLVQPMKFKG